MNILAGTLRDVVEGWVREQVEEGYTSALDDLCEQGCMSGIVSELIYYSDTVAFYTVHEDEISEMLADTLSEVGVSCPAELFGDMWEVEDPLARGDLNRNLLAWFAFETVAQRLQAERED